MNAAVKILGAALWASMLVSRAFAAGGIEKSTNEEYIKHRNAIKKGDYTPLSLKNEKLCADDSLVGNYIFRHKKVWSNLLVISLKEYFSTIGEHKDLFVDKCSTVANKTYEKGIFRPLEGKVNGAPAFVLQVKSWKNAITAKDTKEEDIVQALSFITQEASGAPILQTEGAALFVDMNTIGITDVSTISAIETAFRRYGRVLFPFALSKLYIVNAKKVVKLAITTNTAALQESFGCEPTVSSVKDLPEEIKGILPKSVIDKEYNAKETDKWDMKLMNALTTGKRADGSPINYNDYWKA